MEAPFPRGKSWTMNFGSAVAGSTDGIEFEGVDKDFSDYDWVNYPKRRTNRYVRCRIVRNSSGIALKPSRLVQLDAANYYNHALGYTITDGQRGYPVDEFLPSGGVLANDLFWVVLRGPAMLLSGLNADGTNVITQGQEVTALTTAASSQGSSAGAVKSAISSGATTPLFNEIAHFIGVALSSLTTGNTGANVLVDVRMI